MKSNWDKYRNLNIRIGLIVSLGLALAAFEWKTYEPVSIIDLGTPIVDDEEWVPTPVTETPPPPKPKPVLAPVITEVENDDIEDLDVEVEFEPDDVEIVIDIPEEDEPTVEKVEEPAFYLAPEVQATPEGGIKAFLQYIGKEIEYPRQAKRMGVQGKVFLQFIVDKKGNITDIKVLRGIGAGCDEEAVRVLKAAPQWKPAKQRGRPVKQKMTFPINFQLG